MTEEKKDDILKINKNVNDENSDRRGNYLNI